MITGLSASSGLSRFSTEIEGIVHDMRQRQAVELVVAHKARLPQAAQQSCPSASLLGKAVATEARCLGRVGGHRWEQRLNIATLRSKFGESQEDVGAYALVLSSVVAVEKCVAASAGRHASSRKLVRSSCRRWREWLEIGIRHHVEQQAVRHMVGNGKEVALDIVDKGDGSLGGRAAPPMIGPLGCSEAIMSKHRSNRSRSLRRMSW